MSKLKDKLTFIFFWLVNSVLLYLATLIYPESFVLGTFRLSVLSAAIFAGFWFTAIVWISKPIITKLNIKLKGRVQAFLFYWLANSAAIWLVARFSAITGFGIVRFCWAIGLGLIANIIQWGIWQVCKGIGWVEKK